MDIIIEDLDDYNNQDKQFKNDLLKSNFNE